MTKITKTYQELFELNSVAGGYLARHKEDNKLCEKIKNMATKQLKKHFESLNENDESLRIDHCAIDEKTKVILRDKDGGYQFDKDGLKAFNKAAKEFRENEKVELHARISEYVPDDLTDEEIECFSGLLIPIDYAKSIEVPMQATKSE